MSDPLETVALIMEGSGTDRGLSSGLKPFAALELALVGNAAFERLIRQIIRNAWFFDTKIARVAPNLYGGRSHWLSVSAAGERDRGMWRKTVADRT